MKICVFCSANNNLATEYSAAAQALGKWIGNAGHTLVFGGTDLGLMETVARATHDAGGMVVGVVPSIVEKGGHASDVIDVKMHCDNLADRKQLMIDQSDILLALPGGVGTLDEIFTVAASANIGYHHKRVVLLNVGGFWNSLIAMLDDLKTKGVLRAGIDQTIVAVNTVDEAIALMEQ